MTIEAIFMGVIFIIGGYAICQVIADWHNSKKINVKTRPRPYSFVRFKFENIAEEDKSYYLQFQLEKNQNLIFISEIANMPGHCIVTKTTRNKDESDSVRTYTGYHTMDFVELTDEEM